MLKRSQTIFATFVSSTVALSLSAKPLLAHNGHSDTVDSQNQQSPSETESKDMPEMSRDEESPTVPIESKDMPKMSTDSTESENSTVPQATTESQPISPSQEKSSVAETTATTSQSILGSPRQIIGESFLALLVATPFVFLFLKRSLHK